MPPGILEAVRSDKQSSAAMYIVNPTVRIWYENLAAMVVNDRKPLSDLAFDRHVHGGLRLEIGGRLVPYLGYWGPDDVCFGEWVNELWLAAKALRDPGGRHVYDEGEQGQPAFVFEREGDRGFFSIAASEISEEEAHPDWQHVEFSPRGVPDRSRRLSQIVLCGVACGSSDGCRWLACEAGAE
jgi:hypothetical protein